MAYEIKIGDHFYHIAIQELEGTYVINLDGKVYRVDLARPAPSHYSLIIDGKSYNTKVNREEASSSVWISGKTFSVEVIDEREKALRNRKKNHTLEGEQRVISSMPGKVISILAQVGQQVKQGEGLIIIQAMKMENELKSPKDGEVIEICIQEGKKVEGGEVLLIIG